MEFYWQFVSICCTNKFKSKPQTFSPKFQITAAISKNLMTIEDNKELVNNLAITPQILASLIESSKLITTHYSTMIDGNKLNEQEIIKVIKNQSQKRLNWV